MCCESSACDARITQGHLEYRFTMLRVEDKVGSWSGIDNVGAGTGSNGVIAEEGEDCVVAILADL